MDWRERIVSDLQTLHGKARVQGVALGASGQITDQWAIFANYTYLDSEVLQGVSRANAARGLDFTKGDPLTNVPDHAFSLFTTYDVTPHIQVFGRGGSRRAGEQAAARLALEVAEQALQKSPAAARKSRPRSAQLKLAGIATDQSELGPPSGNNPA